jgi:rubrerythrin
MIDQTIEITKMEAEMVKRYARLPVLTCKRCGHKWVPRISSPAVCPNCHSPYWNKSPVTKRGDRRRKR